MTDTIIGYVDHQRLGDREYRIEFGFSVPENVDTETFIAALVRKFEADVRKLIAET